MVELSSKGLFPPMRSTSKQYGFAANPAPNETPYDEALEEPKTRLADGPSESGDSPSKQKEKEAGSGPGGLTLTLTLTLMEGGWFGCWRYGMESDDGRFDVFQSDQRPPNPNPNPNWMSLNQTRGLAISSPEPDANTDLETAPVSPNPKPNPKPKPNPNPRLHLG